MSAKYWWQDPDLYARYQAAARERHANFEYQVAVAQLNLDAYLDYCVRLAKEEFAKQEKRSAFTACTVELPEDDTSDPDHGF